jgi:glutaredoxin
MKKVTVLRLSGCRYCEELISKLELYEVEYELIDADEDWRFADRVEEIVDASSYPMIIIEDKGFLTFYIFRAESIDQIGEASLQRAVKIGAMSIDSMVDITLNLI